MSEVGHVKIKLLQYEGPLKDKKDNFTVAESRDSVNHSVFRTEDNVSETRSASVLG
jgi:hypothetical protein